MFPNYLFVFVCNQWRSLLGTRGIRRLILDAERPARMPEYEIEALRRRENDKGVIELPAPFEADQAVHIIGGHFIGQTAIVVGMPAPDRVRVLLELFGRKVPINVDKGLVAA